MYIYYIYIYIYMYMGSMAVQKSSSLFIYLYKTTMLLYKMTIEPTFENVLVSGRRSQKSAL